MRTARGEIAVAMVNSATIYINDLLLFSGKFVLFKFLKNGVKTSLFFLNFYKYHNTTCLFVWFVKDIQPATKRSSVVALLKKKKNHYLFICFRITEKAS